MGMFDYITCHHKLPCNECTEIEFQTKSAGCNLDKFTLTADGRLLVQEFDGPDEKEPYCELKKSDFTGWMTFYTSNNAHPHHEGYRWFSFDAEFFRGDLMCLRGGVTERGPIGLKHCRGAECSCRQYPGGF